MNRVSRRLERKLLILLGVYFLNGLIILYFLGNAKIILLISMFLSFLSFLFISYYWERKNARGDLFLLPLVAALSCTSLIFLYRLDIAYCWRQMFWLLAGVIALVLTTSFLPDCRRLIRYKYTYAIIGGLALIIPIFFGIEQGGAKSWVNFGLFQIQPSEFAKILLVLFLAGYLAEYKQSLAHGAKNFLGLALPYPQEWLPLVAMWGLSLILLVFQRDLGTALIYFTTFLAMLFIATSRMSYVIFGFGLFLAGIAASYHLLGHVRNRVEVWLSPWCYVEDAGYQVVQSLFALGAGGFWGSGLGAGYPKFIPAIHTDFIFAAVTEEMGLLGGAALILIYLFILFRGFKIALTASNDFTVLLSGGLTALMGIQTFVIIAGVIKLLPLTGITLPFVSYGGSSLVANYVILGLLLNISRETGVSYEK